MDNLTKALDYYKIAFQKKLDSYVILDFPILPLDNKNQELAPPKSKSVSTFESNPETNKNILDEVVVPNKTSSLDNQNTQQKNTAQKKTKATQETASSVSNIGKSESEPTEQLNQPPVLDNNTLPQSQPLAVELPSTSIRIKPRHIAHRIITSTSIRIGLGLILLLFM